ncbi:MAG: hypothetical protein ABSD44_13435 [Terracidiphilus sp.]
MKKVVMTFGTVDLAGKPDGGSVDVEFGVDQKATPPNSLAKFKLAVAPASSSGGPVECRLSSVDAHELVRLVTGILTANPVP